MVKILSTPNNPIFAKSIFTDVSQTRTVIDDPTKYFVMINGLNIDGNKTNVNQDILSFLESSDIEPVLFSERENYVEEFAK